MKFQVMFKTPDALENAIKDVVETELYELKQYSRVEEHFRETRTEELMHFAKRWVKYSEYITIEFDTKNETAEVVER